MHMMSIEQVQQRKKSTKNLDSFDIRERDNYDFVSFQYALGMRKE